MYDFLVRMNLAGDSGVGKSCLILRFVDDTYTDSFIPTIGVDYKRKDMLISNKECRFQIWDKPSQERFRVVNDRIRRNIDINLLCYDITDRQSFEKACADYNSQYNPVPTLLIGTKSDLQDVRTVSYEEAEAWAKAQGIQYIEASAKNALNVDAVFELAGSIVLAEKYGIKNNVQSIEKKPFVFKDSLDKLLQNFDSIKPVEVPEIAQGHTGKLKIAIYPTRKMQAKEFLKALESSEGFKELDERYSITARESKGSKLSWNKYFYLEVTPKQFDNALNSNIIIKENNNNSNNVKDRNFAMDSALSFLNRAPAPLPKEKPIIITSCENQDDNFERFERDLELALKLSMMPNNNNNDNVQEYEPPVAIPSPVLQSPNASAKSSQLGLFAAPAPEVVKPANPAPSLADNDITRVFECPISFEIMKKPMLCSLSGQTFEKEEIVKVLKETGTDPFSGKKMAPGQTIADVLSPNLALQALIDVYNKTQQPEPPQPKI